MMDIKQLESWLWDAACCIRGPVDAPKYKDYILPLIFVKRLSDVFDEEIDKLAKEYGNRETVLELIEEDHKLVWFYMPKNTRWDQIKLQSTKLGEYLTDVVRDLARENPKLQGVIDTVDFNTTHAGTRIISDDILKTLVNILNKHGLGMNDVEPDILGRAYEFLLRKFAEGSGQSAGEFYTPKESAILMAKMMHPQQGETVYDPCAGSGGLLIKTFLEFKELHGKDTTIKPLQFFGQEYLPGTYAMARMNLFIHNMDAKMARGDTMNKPAFLNPDGSLMKFDVVVANPMWNQDIFTQATYDNDAFGRFGHGNAPNSSADWAWIQHMYTSLTDKGRMAVVLDTGSVSRGSGNQGTNKERDIRKKFVEEDLIEAVILMPANLFYNTSAPGVIVILNRQKKNDNQILLINASKLFKKGRPKNFLPPEAIERIASIYLEWKEEEGISKSLTKEEIAEKDYNLSPSRYVSQNGAEEVMPLADAVVLLKEAEEERAEADKKLKEVLTQLGFE